MIRIILSAFEVGVLFTLYPVKPGARSYVSQGAVTYLLNEFVLKMLVYG